MATESPIRMLGSDGSKNWPCTVDPVLFTSKFSNIAGHEDFTKVLNECGVLGKHTRIVPDRSGSAPPTVEGSLASLRTFMDKSNPTLTSADSDVFNSESEEQMRTDPAYIAYYYANVNLNPRLPPPLLSRENRHLVQLMGRFGSTKVTSATEGLLATHREEPDEDTSPEQSSGDHNGKFVTEQKRASFVVRKVGQVDIMQGDFPQAPSPASGAAVKGENDLDSRTDSAARMSDMQESCSGSVDVHEDARTVNCPAIASVSCTGIRAIRSCHKLADLEDNMSTQSISGSDISVLESRMKSLNVSSGFITEDNPRRHENIHLENKNRLPCHPLQNTMYQVPGFHGPAIPQEMPGLHGNVENLSTVNPKLLGMQPFMHSPGPVPPLYAATAAFMNSGNLFYPSLQPPGFLNPQFRLGGFGASSAFHPPFVGGYLQNSVFPAPIDAYCTSGFFKQPIEASGEMNPYISQMMLRPSFSGPPQGHFLQKPFDIAQRSAVLRSQLTGRDGVQGQFDVHASQRGSVTSSLTSDRNLSATGNLGISAPANGSCFSVNYGGDPSRLGMAHFRGPSHIILPVSPMSGASHPGPGNDLSASQHSPKNVVGKGQRGSDNSDDSRRHSFLELLKSCNSRMLELSDISGQITEFSTDQHGSRFIQQKLEYCSSEEKESVFKEVLSHAPKLMIDVFGNYVIQKFFEHGTAEHRRKLGEQLTGQIVTLSLQMYGCRVIQKALEVIELDQKVELVQELDGNVMRCVHDQNGNHVIQKCIESVPAENIGFIISSFHGQVATLSSHPYGCRVIQRVLEHCSDEKISRCIIDEILESACTLVQDPYGNYVTQHVFEMGKPQERSQIIHKLTGKFVQMSQHKYASNVVEKCLKYGDSSERKLIIEEIVGQSDDDDALLMMMKDQFANYVVQKIFDIGSDKQKDILLSCVRTHLPVLKRFPYAKHIVARYEQLSEGSVQEQR